MINLIFYIANKIITISQLTMYSSSPKTTEFFISRASQTEKGKGNGWENSQQKLRASKQKQSKDHQLKRMRMMNSIEPIAYESIRYGDFLVKVEESTNPYSLLVTLFSIADQFNWRQYLTHLQAVLKKLNNILYESFGQFLFELSQCNFNKSQNVNSELINFQERFEKLLYLSDKTFQHHLLIFLHGLVAYNSQYKVINEENFSVHLLHRHPYENCVRPEIFWIITRMTVNQTAVVKILKSYFSHTYKNQILLPIITILVNFVADRSCEVIEQLVLNQMFQQILWDGLNSHIYVIERESVLLCNNIISKNQNCQNFLLSQTNVVNTVMVLHNEQTQYFNGFIQHS